MLRKEQYSITAKRLVCSIVNTMSIIISGHIYNAESTQEVQASTKDKDTMNLRIIK